MTAIATTVDAEQRLYELWAEIRDLKSTEELLDWDQETYLPAGGQGDRGTTQATLAALRHRLMCAPELSDVLSACAETADEGGELAAQVRVAQRYVDLERRIPESLAKALAKARSAGTVAWQRARAEADFSKFERELAELVALRREEAAALAPGGSPYDAMLDRFEPGATEAALVPLFDSLGAALTPLLERVRDRGLEVDESPVLGDFDPEGQRRLGVHAATAFGFDFERGRLDATAHPFCVALTRSDVRLTWRWQRDDLRPALFGILHEAGHGLYEQGLPREWWRQPLGDPGSLGIHESQSRLWENHVGRSEGFWRWIWPTFTDAFPEHAAGTDPAAMWAALHTARPSLIRVEADEATYNQHVIVRFELERRLFRGDLQVPELPEAWDALYREVLGLSAPDAADGVLQDIHWSQGMFGYFPTYTLGSMISAQLFAAAERDLGPQEDAFEAGEFSPLLAWLRDRIHRHGGRFPAAELVQRATGRPLSADDLLRHLTSSLERAYDL